MKINSEQILTEWLVINCQMGDADALQELMKIWYPKLLRYATRQLSSYHQAQDAVQNTFEVVSKTIKKLNDPAAFPKWLYQILQRKSVDVIRNSQRQNKLCDNYIQFQSLANSDAQASTSGHLSFDALLVGLEPNVYQLLHLHYLEGFSMQEISELLAIPAGTVKSRLHQARQVLRVHLSNDPTRRN